MKFFAITLAAALLPFAAQAESAIDPVTRIMKVAEARWATMEGNAPDYFDNLDRDFSKDFAAVYREATKYPAYDGGDSPFDYDVITSEASQVIRVLVGADVLKPDVDAKNLANSIAMEASARFDRMTRDFAARRLSEYVPEKGLELVRELRHALIEFLQSKGALRSRPGEVEWSSLETRLAQRYGPLFDEHVLLEDVTRLTREMVDFLASLKAVVEAQKLTAD